MTMKRRILLVAWLLVVSTVRGAQGDFPVIPREEAYTELTQRRPHRYKVVRQSSLAGNTSAYVAMFDEIDEGTAIFKCTNNPPIGASKFQTFGADPPDHYLWLVGEASQLLRGDMPQRKSCRKLGPDDRR